MGMWAVEEKGEREGQKKVVGFIGGFGFGVWMRE